MTVHKRTWDHLPSSTGVQRFNKAVALKITNVVGSMWCAYVFTVLSLVSLPAVLTEVIPSLHIFPHWLVSASLIALVAWIAQTFLQLVLLSVIMVGQSVQSLASDARAEKTLKDTEIITDKLDLHTEGGLKAVIDAIEATRCRCQDGSR